MSTPPVSFRDRLRRQAWGLLALLVLENLLGIFANLYITLPAGNAIEAIFTSFPVLTVHVVNGFLMLALAATMVVSTHRAGYRRLRNVAIFEVVFLAVAIQEGFAYSATQNNLFSFGMEAAFVFAVVGVATLLYRLGPPLETVPTQGTPTSV